MEQQENLFAFFGDFDVPEELFLPLRSVTVEKADCYPKQQLLKVYVKTDHLINSDLFYEAADLIARKRFSGEGVKIKIIPQFHLGRSLTAMEALELYHENILWELHSGKSDIPSYLLYKDATIKQSDVGVVITLDNSFMAEMRGTALKEYIQGVLSERFGIETRVVVEVQEDPEIKEEMLRKLEADRQKALLESMTQVRVEVPAIPSKENKNATRNRRQAKTPDLLYGRNTEGELMRIEDLEPIEGEVVIHGKIQSIEERETKNKSKVIWTAILTDFTDSIKVKLFLKPAEAVDLKAELQTEMFVKVKGLLAFDSFDKEKVISNVIGISKEQDFTLHRADTAKQKRVELHCHTKASDMDGVSDVRDIVRNAYAWGMPAVAITDHGVVHAFPDANHEREDLWKSYKKKCEKDGVDPGKYEDFFKVIYGMEGYLVNDIEDTEPELPIQDKTSYHIVLLAQNDIGRVNLYTLISKSHLEYYKKRPRIPKSELLKYKEGLIIGSACEAGELFRAILRGDSEQRIEQIASLYDYLEVQPVENNHFMLLNDEKYPQIQTEEDLRDLNRRVVTLGEKLNKPVVATCDVHFLNPEDDVYRRIIMASKGYSDADNQAPLYFRTTDEMLEEFSYLGEDKAYQIVVTNSNLIADSIEAISPVRPDKCPPVIENSDVELREICAKRAHELYGENLPPIVEERMNKELDSIIGNGYAVMYIIAQKLVWKSVADGYLVGSRGSVGSSFAAFLAGITEVNSLAPHYRCAKCYYTDFDSEEVKAFSGGAGCDMPDKICPVCGERLLKDGFDIPFETFLGFNGDKEPDIDLNFSGEYQARIHQYTEEIFGKGQTFKAGTISGVADKTAYGLIRGYFENRGFSKRNAEIERLKPGCTGVRKSTGQHPGGIIVLPKGENINSFTPKIGSASCRERV